MRSEAPALLPIFRSQHQAELLAWALLHPGQERTMTDLARQLGVPVNTLHREVQRLVEAGILASRSVGRARLISANPSHPATDSLRSLLEVTYGPPTVIAEEFDEVVGAELVFIFGSWAERHHGTAGPPPNDVDVLVVGSPDRTDVYGAADRAQQRLGIEVNPVIRSLEQWRTPADQADRLVAQIQASPTLRVLPDYMQGPPASEPSTSDDNTGATTSALSTDTHAGTEGDVR